MPSADPRPRHRQPPADMSVQTSLLVLGCNHIHKGAFSAGHHMRTVPVFASTVVNLRRSIQCFASLVVNTRRSIAPAAQLRRRHRGTCQFSLRDLVVQHAGHHPCWRQDTFSRAPVLLTSCACTDLRSEQLTALLSSAPCSWTSPCQGTSST